MDEFINSQKSILGITDFLQSAETYTKNNFPDLDINQLFTSAVSGNITNNFWTSTILNFARRRNQNITQAYDYSINCYYYT